MQNNIWCVRAVFPTPTIALTELVKGIFDDPE
jgi:energy-converting hydrogenase Eha subunit A